MTTSPMVEEKEEVNAMKKFLEILGGVLSTALGMAAVVFW